MKILVVSQEGETSRRVVLGLQQGGFVVNMYGPYDDVRSLIAKDDGLAVLIGPDLRGIEPRTLVRSLRASGDDRPVLVVASDHLYAQRVALLNTGADDVFAHPCPVEEIAARVKAVVRRARGFAKPEIALADVVLDLNGRCVNVGPTKVALTSKEYQILELLAVNRGKVLSKDTIMNHLYDYDAVPDAKIIDVFVCKIRKKLVNAGAPETISTVWGQGYMVRDERSGARGTARAVEERRVMATT
ncbi:MAG: response regulator transcription factor [Bryobacteraceae bacterium]|nr:response regulator transcription factor [Bryobacteraceae bacterium]